MPGPAREQSSIPFLGSLKQRMFTGTGLAQPKTKAPERLVSKKHKRPMGSMCGRGLRVMRPMSLAVGSPILRAAQPWPTSWRMMPRKAGMKTMAKWRTDSAKPAPLKRSSMACVLLL